MRIRPFSGYRDKSQYSQRKLENFQLSPHAITTSFAVPLKGSQDSLQQLRASRSKQIFTTRNIQPNSLIPASVLQDSQSSRLYKGGLEWNFSTEKDSDNPLFKFELLESDTKVLSEIQMKIEQDYREFIDQIQELKYLNSIKLELDFNYKLAREQFDIYNNDLGIISSVKESINKNSIEIDKLSKQGRDYFINELKEHTCTIREFMRQMKSRNLINEMVALEIFWRSITKLFDQALYLHDYQINQCFELAKDGVKMQLEDKRIQLQKFKNETYTTIAQLEETLQKQQKTITVQQSQITNLKQQVLDRDIRIAELTEIDQQLESMRCMDMIMSSMNHFLRETESEAQKQADTLHNIENIMDLACKYEMKPPSADKEVQTQLKLLEHISEANEYLYPRFSDNPFYEMMSFVNIDVFGMDKEEVLEMCQKALDLSQDQSDMRKAILQFISEKSDNCNEMKKYTQHFLSKLSATASRSDKKAQTFSVLLNVDTYYPIHIQRFVFQLNQHFDAIKDKETGQAQLLSVIRLCQKLFIDQPQSGKQILSRLWVKTNHYKPIVNAAMSEKVSQQYVSEVYNETNINLLQNIISKISLGMLRPKRVLKSVLRQYTTSLNGIMKSDFYDAIASYLNIWITDKEFESLWTYIDYQGKGTVDIVQVLSKVNQQEGVVRGKSCFIDKDDFIFSCIIEWQKVYQNYKQLISDYYPNMHQENFRQFTKEKFGVVEEQLLTNSFIHYAKHKDIERALGKYGIPLMAWLHIPDYKKARNRVKK